MQRGSWGPEKARYLAEVTQPVNCRARTQTHAPGASLWLALGTFSLSVYEGWVSLSQCLSNCIELIQHQHGQCVAFDPNASLSFPFLSWEPFPAFLDRPPRFSRFLLLPNYCAVCQFCVSFRTVKPGLRNLGLKRTCLLFCFHRGKMVPA